MAHQAWQFWLLSLIACEPHKRALATLDMITTLKIQAKFDDMAVASEGRALLIDIDDDYTCQTRLKSMGT